MNKHTPGPWKVVTSWYDYSVEGPNSEEIIWQDGPYQTPTIKLSDARLIAAAPEMLELLQELRVAEEYGYEANVLLRIRLNKLATRAVALLAKIAGNE